MHRSFAHRTQELQNVRAAIATTPGFYCTKSPPVLLAKRRSANHPCPVCGKFYVNEGSLRKHLACHPEMATQLAASASALRMWPCSVCTAVFTHEGGLLAHMEQMRMEPKHQVREQGETLFNQGLRLVSIFKKTQIGRK